METKSSDNEMDLKVTIFEGVNLIHLRLRVL
jgi:hypothetical protein